METRDTREEASGGVLRIGDTLGVSLYGYTGNLPVPVLLMAAGQRIESSLQLRRLGEAGFRVEMPAGASRDSPPPAPLPRSTVQLTPDQIFAQRYGAAREARALVVTAAQDLLARVRDGTRLDTQLLQSCSAQLASQVAADPYTFTALTFLMSCDDYTVQHSADVAILVTAMGKILGASDAELPVLALAGLLHDVGKQRLPGEILNKPAVLTQEEYDVVKQHPRHGFEILDQWPECPEEARTAVLQHHERWDGSGYPSGIAGEALHRFSRMVAVADSFDAMCATHVCRRSRPPRAALRELYDARARLFSEEPVLALIKLVGVYPVGTRVQLHTGERAVVVAPNMEDTTRPTILIDQDRSGRALDEPFPVNLRSSRYRIVGAVT